MADWRKAPPMVPEDKPVGCWWTDPEIQRDPEKFRRAVAEQQNRLRNLGTKAEPVNRLSDDFQGAPRGRSFKRRDNR